MATKPQKPLAPEFLSMLAENGHSALYRWLERNAAPAQATDLVMNLESIYAYLEAVALGRFDHLRHFEILETVGNTIDDIAELGGKFYGVDCSESIPREPVKWQPPEPTPAPSAGPDPLMLRLVRDLLAGTADADTIAAAKALPVGYWDDFDLASMVGGSNPANVNDLVNTTVGRKAMAEALRPEVVK
jgi:hypothetical protein